METRKLIKTFNQSLGIYSDKLNKCVDATVDICRTRVQQFRKHAKALMLVIVGGLLIGCSNNAYWNGQISFDDRALPMPNVSRPTVHLASLEVPWWVEPDCRANFSWEDYENTIEKASAVGYYSANPTDYYCSRTKQNNDEVFFGVAFSGGGARAALFSAAVLFELEEHNLLEHVDVISAASGGAMAAALYAISCSEDQESETSRCEGAKIEDRQIRDVVLRRNEKERPKWDKEEVFKKISQPYFGKWLGNRLWPENLIRRLFTAYDLTDVFAETLSDNLYDESTLGGQPFQMRDLNPQRPNLIINATNFTDDQYNSRDLVNTIELADGDKNFRRLSTTDPDNFTFTVEDFDKLKSTLATFDISRAVATSSAYPGAFNYSTLARWERTKQPDESDDDPLGFKHLFDAGANDNLALEGLLLSLEEEKNKKDDGSRPSKIIIMVVDAQNGFIGKSSSDPDPRNFTDIFLDANFIDAYDTLMKGRYEQLLIRANGLLDKIAPEGGVNLIHLPLLAFNCAWTHYEGKSTHRWKDNDMARRQERQQKWAKLRSIGTGYGLEPDEQKILETAAVDLVSNESARLEEILNQDSDAARKDFQVSEAVGCEGIIQQPGL